MPPKVLLDVPRPSVEPASVPVAENHDYALSLPAPTKTWPRDCPDPHEYAAARPVRDSRNKSGKGRCVKLSAYVQFISRFPAKPRAGRRTKLTRRRKRGTSEAVGRWVQRLVLLLVG